MLSMEHKHLKIVKDILSRYPYHFYAFGSRTTGNAKQYSDLDLCFKEQIPSHVIVEIEEHFEDSDLPFTVDLVDWKNCSQDFRKRIDKDLSVIDL